MTDLKQACCCCQRGAVHLKDPCGKPMYQGYLLWSKPTAQVEYLIEACV